MGVGPSARARMRPPTIASATPHAGSPGSAAVQNLTPGRPRPLPGRRPRAGTPTQARAARSVVDETGQSVENDARRIRPRDQQDMDGRSPTRACHPTSSNSPRRSPCRRLTASADLGCELLTRRVAHTGTDDPCAPPGDPQTRISSCSLAPGETSRSFRRKASSALSQGAVPHGSTLSDRTCARANTCSILA